MSYFISNHIYFFITQNHNHIASAGFTICTAIDIICPYTLNSSEEKDLYKPSHIQKKKKLLTG